MAGELPDLRGTVADVPASPVFSQPDWASFSATFLVSFAVYFWTLAPDVTLENSGGLAAAANYGGVAYNPGFPVWTIYSWLFTKLLPFGTVAWRIGVSSALAASVAAGLVALMVSRGSRIILAQNDKFTRRTPKQQNWICAVAGWSAGMGLALSAPVWRKAVIVDIWSLDELAAAGLLCLLMRWALQNQSSPHPPASQIESSEISNQLDSPLQPRQGRNVCSPGWSESASETLGQPLNQTQPAPPSRGRGQGEGAVSQNSHRCLYLAFLVYGLSLTEFWEWLLVGPAILFWVALFNPKLGRDLCLAGFLLGFCALSYLQSKAYAMDIWPLRFELEMLLLLGIVLIVTTGKVASEWRASIASLLILGAACLVSLYIAVASMTTPPVNWGYPRTVEGFLHTISRGQYDQIHPTAEIDRYFYQAGAIFLRTGQQLGWISLVFAAGSLLLLIRGHPAGRRFQFGLLAFFLCAGPLMIATLNPSWDKQDLDLHDPYWIPLFVILSVLSGLGIAASICRIGRVRRRATKTVPYGPEKTVRFFPATLLEQ